MQRLHDDDDEWGKTTRKKNKKETRQNGGCSAIEIGWVVEVRGGEASGPSHFHLNLLFGWVGKGDAGRQTLFGEGPKFQTGRYMLAARQLSEKTSLVS